MTDHRMSCTFYDSLNMIVNDDYEQIKGNNNERGLKMKANPKGNDSTEQITLSEERRTHNL